MDELLLSKIRLSVIAQLLTADRIPFSDLLRATQTTNGNLGAHITKLVDAGYLEEEKIFVDRKPQTRYSLTKIGRDAFVRHVREMQSLLSENAS